MKRETYFPIPECNIIYIESLNVIMSTSGSGSVNSGSDGGGITPGFEWEEG